MYIGLCNDAKGTDYCEYRKEQGYCAYYKDDCRKTCGVCGRQISIDE